MVSMLGSGAVDRGFEPRSGQTKDYKIGICCFSAKHAALRRNTDCLKIKIMCPSGATCLAVSYNLVDKLEESCAFLFPFVLSLHPNW